MRRAARSRRSGRWHATTGRSRVRRYADYALTLAILLVLAVVAVRLGGSAPAGTAIVNDGDSLTIGGERIRLHGIDAPEFDQTCLAAGRDYACGRQSRQALQALVRGREVVCEGWERDRYGRLLAVCRTGETDINRQQVEAGWAVAYGAYGDAERAAREAGRGLWAGRFDPPRDWRAAHGRDAEAEHAAGARIVDWIRQLVGW